MKTSITKTAILAALALIITAGSGCKKEDMRLNAQNPTDQTSSLSNKPTPGIGASSDLNIYPGKMIVFLKDIGTAGLGSINLTFTGIALHYQDERIGTKGWVYLQTKPRTIDVLQYQTGTGFILAGSKTLPLGVIDEARVLFGNPNYVIWGNSDGRFKADLMLDKAAALTGIPLKARVTTDRTVALTLGINSNQSIDREIADHYMLKPAIYQEGVRWGDVNPD